MQQDQDMQLQSMYDTYQAVLRTIARKRGIPVDDIDDLLQETYIAYYRKYSLTWNEARKKAMLVKILKRKCIDFYRRNSYYIKVSMDNEESFDETELLAQTLVKDSLDSVINNETYREIRECILNMKKDWRDVSFLYFVEGFTTQEICDILDISGTVCRSRISRARKYLKSALRHLLND